MARQPVGGWNPNDSIAKGIDTCNVKLLGQIAEKLREEGCTYHEILQRVQAVRPDVTEADWEAIMYDSETGED